MKIQNGFISSSSSTSISYSTYTKKSSRIIGYSEGYEKIVGQTSTSWVGGTYNTYSDLKNDSYDQNVTWKTYKSSSYQRIEYFMEAVEKLNTAYTRKISTLVPMYEYSGLVGEKELYDGFVDVVITFPCKIRLAGIELLNPWNNKLSNDSEYDYWKYLPKKFSIFKVNDDLYNDNLEKITYENDIANFVTRGKENQLRPVFYQKIEKDDNLILLGSYNVNWENISNYKCFFKYNVNDKVSISTAGSETSVGTATWECKQLVLRIYKGYDKLTDYKYYLDDNGERDFSKGILKNICEYILDKELGFGTTVYDEPVTLEDIEIFYKVYLEQTPTTGTDTLTVISEASNSQPVYSDLGFKFGGKTTRSYRKSSDISFLAGIEYKLGGIQLLLSPDIFSVSEMKMYNYCNMTNNKVFIGEWNANDGVLVYYGSGTTKRSSLIDVSGTDSPAIIWKHNFNIPPKYLDVKVYAQFTVDYGSFYAGDVISNIVNVNREPLTLRLTGTDVMLNISNGICFTNPETGEFMVFKDGKGIQMDRVGNNDAYNAALAINANIVAHQSIVSTKIEADDPSKGDAYPFKIYFVVKRLF